MTAMPDYFSTSSLPRRKFLTIGGFSVATAAVVAACGSSGETGAGPNRVAQAGGSPVTSVLPDRTMTDAVLLRTASSLERSILSVYETVLSYNIINGPALDFIKIFVDHHHRQAAFFDAQTTDAGGTPFTDANPVVTKNIVTPTLTAIQSSADKVGDVQRLLHSMENVVTETYQSFVPLLSQPKMRAAVMSVGTADARHAAAWAELLGGAIAPSLEPVVAPSSTVKGAAEVVVVPTYQAPQPFSAMGLVSTLLNGKKVDLDLLGPNSYAY